jgi:hypothetical protein
VGVDVDEPGRDDEPGGVDLAPGRALDGADGGDGLAVDGDVGGAGGCARAVDDHPVADDQVVHAFPLMWDPG